MAVVSVILILVGKGFDDAPLRWQCHGTPEMDYLPVLDLQCPNDLERFEVR